MNSGFYFLLILLGGTLSAGVAAARIEVGEALRVRNPRTQESREIAAGSSFEHSGKDPLILESVGHVPMVLLP